MRTAPSSAVLGGLCVVALGVATNVATSVLPNAWQPYLWIAWPALAVLIIVFVTLEVRRARDGSDETPVTSTRSRTVLLDRVHRYWIKGVLERSFYQQARIELGLETTVDTAHPWDIVATEPDSEPRLLPPGTAMHTVFDDLDRTMLVLGDPGSGKTTMLLELLRDLLAAATNRDDPIPVMLNLSSWTQRREPLENWIVREVSERYQVAPRHVRAWLAADELLPLLDGLDEVAVAHRGACVAAINAFRNEHGALSIAVGCRSADYDELLGNLRMYGTLRLQPLTPDQVVQFLDRNGPATAAARATLARRPELRELMSSPLMLSVLVLAFQSDTPIDNGPAEGDASRLFHTFVATMLRRHPNPHCPPRVLLRSLAHMANRMRFGSQTQFTIDQIDYYWLSREARWRPQLLANLACMAFGLVALIGAGYVVYGWRGALAGGVAGLAFGLPAERLDSWDISYFQKNSDSSLRQLAPSDWGVALVAVFVFLDEYPLATAAAVPMGAAIGVVLGVPGGLIATFSYGLAAAVALFVAARAGYFSAHNIGQIPARRYGAELPSPKVRAALPISLLVALMIGLLAGGLSWLVLTVLPHGDARGFALFAGIGAAAYALTCLGLYAAVEQVLIRRVLHKADLFPLPARRMLDHATRSMFLHKVGDSYLFTHQSLLEFFLTLHPDDGSWRVEQLVGQ